jgi:hypothetical protein
MLPIRKNLAVAQIVRGLANEAAYQQKAQLILSDGVETNCCGIERFTKVEASKSTYLYLRVRTARGQHFIDRGKLMRGQDMICL